MKGFVHTTLLLIFVLFVAVGTVFLLVKRINTLEWKKVGTVQKIQKKLEQIVPVYNAPTSTPTPPDKTLMPVKLEHPAKGKLVYINDNQIYMINADRSGLTQLTNDESDKYDLAVAPNGKMIAYLSRKDGDPNGPGPFSRYWTNLYIYNFDTKSVHKINTGQMASFSYPTFSNDSKYITVWVTGKSRIYRIADGKVVKELATGQTDSASPIIFLDNNKVTYVLNGKLYLDEIDNQDRDLILADVDESRPVHEGPSVPEPPYWSKSLRYVTYYRKGDFYLFDRNKNKEKLLVTGAADDTAYGFATDEKYPLGYPIEFINNEQDFILIKQGVTVRYNISEGKFYDIGEYGSTTQISEDGKTIFGAIDSGVTNAQGTFFDLQNNKESSCKEDIINDHYWWAGGTDLTTRYKTWNHSGSAIVGNGSYSSGKSNFLRILVKDSCYLYDISYGGYSAVWLPD